MKGNLHPAQNMEHEINSAYIYHRVLVKNGKEWETLLMTDSDLQRIRKRNEKNTDMLLSPSLLDKLLSWFGL